MAFTFATDIFQMFVWWTLLGTTQVRCHSNPYLHPNPTNAPQPTLNDTPLIYSFQNDAGNGLASNSPIAHNSFPEARAGNLVVSNVNEPKLCQRVVLFQWSVACFKLWMESVYADSCSLFAPLKCCFFHCCD